MIAIAESRSAAETGLVIAARQGDRNAFDELVRCHHPGVINVVFRLCGDMQLAEDAAQEAFLQAWLHLESFQPGSSLRNWLYRIAVNAALDGLRRSQEKPDRSIETGLQADPGPGPESALIQSEQAGLVRKAILSLPEPGRAALVLREYGGLSYREIASVLDVPLGTVMSRLNHARSHLRKLLAPALLMEKDHE